MWFSITYAAHALFIICSTQWSSGISASCFEYVSSRPCLVVVLSRRNAEQSMVSPLPYIMRKFLARTLMTPVFRIKKGWTYRTHPSHLPTHWLRSMNHVPPTSSHISRPSSQILWRRHLSISSVSNWQSCGMDEIISVAWDRCAVNEEGDEKVSRMVCLILCSFVRIFTPTKNIPVFDSQHSISTDDLRIVLPERLNKLIACFAHGIEPKGG